MPARKWWVLLLLWAGPQILVPTPAEANPCPSVFKQFIELVHPSTRSWSTEGYQDAKADLTRILEADSKTARSNGALAYLGAHHSPESYAALFDILVGADTSGLSGAVDKLTDNQIRIGIWNKRWPWSRALSSKVKWGRSFSQGLRRLLFSHPKTLQLAWPKKPPRNMEELGKLFMDLSHAMGAGEIAETGSRPPILSLPFGTSSFSYPEQVTNALAPMAQRTYSMLDGWSAAFGEDSRPHLTARSLKPLGPFRLLPAYLIKTILPFYHPLSLFSPSEEGYRKWRDARLDGNPATGPPHDQVRQDIDRQFRARARLKYYVAALGRLFFLSAVITAPPRIYNGAQFVWNGGIQRALTQVDDMKKLFKDPEKTKRAIREYSQNKKGNPVVNDYFNPQIEALRERIRKEGDPHGALAKEIRDLEEMRDYLKN